MTATVQHYIDIHSHHANPAPGSVALLNCYDQFEQVLAQQGYYTLGLHPWYLEAATWAAQFGVLTQYASLPQVLAIGECGLDKVTDTPFALQQQVFAAQLQLAGQMNKPLIIHCVRAFEELIAMINNSGLQVPVVIHGFHKHKKLSERLLGQGYYLSFGAALLRDGPLRDTFAAVPADRFFLETDHSDTTIENVYAVAAEIRKISLDEIILQLQQNFKNVFGK
jgi:TatD DNase family protein